MAVNVQRDLGEVSSLMDKTHIPSTLYSVQLAAGSGDCLVQLFPFLFRVKERGVHLPIAFPETICYEHHFPRGWYLFEDPVSDQLNNNAIAANVKEGPSSGGRISPNKGENSSQKKKDPRTSNSADELVLLRRGAKECEGSFIYDSFKGQKPGHICAQVVTRDSTKGGLNVQYLDSVKLSEFMLNMPEQCILSKFIRSKRSSNDVIIATWTPSVFSIERRLNKNRLRDESLPPQQRGELNLLSYQNEIPCCPLVSIIIRETMQRMVWFLEKYEKQTVLEFRAYFKQDKKMVLWFLWCDILRLMPIPQPYNGLSALQQLDREHEIKVHLPKQRKPIDAYVPEKKNDLSQHGAWPSFCRDDDLTFDVLLSIEDELTRVLTEQKKRSNPKVLKELRKDRQVGAISRTQGVTLLTPHPSPSRASGLDTSPKAQDGVSVLPLTLQRDNYLHVHFEEVELSSKHKRPPPVGCVAPPGSPRNASMLELIRPSLPSQEYLESALAEHVVASPKAKVKPLLTSVLSNRSVLSDESNVTEVTAGESRLNPDASDISRQQMVDAALAKEKRQDKVPVSILQLKNRVIAKRHSGGPSSFALSAKKDFQFRTLDAHMQDPLFQANDQRHRGAGAANVRKSALRGGRSLEVLEDTQKGKLRRSSSSLSTPMLSSEELVRLRGLEVNQRVEYEQLKKHNEQLLDAFQSRGYEILSESMKFRPKEYNAFDFPRGCPEPPMSVLNKLGIVEYTDSMKKKAEVFCAEKYCIMGRDVIKAFKDLEPIIIRQLKQREQAFLDRCLRQDYGV